MKKKIENLFFRIDNPVFKTVFAISFAQKEHEIESSMKRVLFKEDWWEIQELFWQNRTNFGYCKLLKCQVIVIRLRMIPKEPEEYGFLQHEIFHAVEFLLHTKDVKYNIETSSEAYAYNIQFLTEKIYEKLAPYI